MDQTDLEGIRLLSFDGADRLALSQLFILDEIMRRVEWDEKSSGRILPCDYFHMMAGVGTGGIIAILLATLRMSAEETMQEFSKIWHAVYANDSLGREARSEKLEALMGELLVRKGIPENRKLCIESSEENECKVFVCAVPESNLGTCHKFRSYKSRKSSTNPTIVEAIRATCAAPSLFTSVGIESVGFRVKFVTGAYNFNNPAGETIKEACELFACNRTVGCMLSLGAGHCMALRVDELSKRDTLSVLAEMGTDCEQVHRDLSWRIGESGIYHRLHVDRLFQSTPGSPENLLGEIKAWTDGYLENPEVQPKINSCAGRTKQLVQGKLMELAGVVRKRVPSTHGLPPLSAFFVERPSLIKTMAAKLFASEGQRRMVLSGLGGIGKTQVTVSFVLQFLSRFRHVLFIDGSSVQSIENGIIAKMKSLGSTYTRATAREALEVLEDPDHEITRDWAIIYDNVDDPSIKIAEYFPKSTFGTIIITTRNPNVGNLAPHAHLKLDVMSEEEGLDVLLRSSFDTSHVLTDMDQKYAHDIAKELGYLPVALVQAGYFIKAHNCMHDYLRRLEKRRFDILNRPAENQVDHHYHSIYTTLNVTWPYLSRRAQCFLSMLGFVNYTGFPVELLYRAARRRFSFEPYNLMDRSVLPQQTIQLLCDTFHPYDEWNEQDVDDLVAELEKYSLVTRMTTFMVATLRFHPLVYSWIRDRLSSEEQDLYRAVSLRALVCVTGTEDEDLFEFIYPHITLLADRLSELHVNDRAGIATIYLHQGDHETAIALWEGIQGNFLGLFGEKDVRTIEASLQLASLCRKIDGGRWDEDTNKSADHARIKSLVELANTIESGAAEDLSHALGPEHPSTMKAVGQWAQGIASDRRRIHHAIKTLRDVLKFWERQPADNWELILQVKDALANALGAVEYVKTMIHMVDGIQSCSIDFDCVKLARKEAAVGQLALSSEALILECGRYAGVPDSSATDLWLSVVDARTKLRGIHHPDTLNALESLTDSYGFRCMTESFTERWKDVVALRREAQGSRHKDVIRMLEKAMEYYDDFGGDQFDGSIFLLIEIIALQKEVLGDSHTDTVLFMQHLVENYLSAEMYDRAEVQWREVISLMKEAYGICHGDTIDTMADLKDKLWHKPNGAVEQGKEVVESKEASGEDYDHTPDAIRRLKGLYCKWLDETEAVWKETIALSSTPQCDLSCLAKLAGCYSWCGRYRHAETLWQHAITHSKEYLFSKKATQDLAGMYVKTQRYGEAEMLWKDLIAQVQPHGDWRTRDARESLAEMYVETQQYGEAETLWKDIIAQVQLHDNCRHIRVSLANMYVKTQRYGEAEVLWKDLIAPAPPPHDAWHTLNAMESLAKMYAEIERYGEAETLWKDLISMAPKRYGPNSQAAQAYAQGLADCIKFGGCHYEKRELF